MNLLAGAGWIRGGEFGCARLGRREALPAGAGLHLLWKGAALLPAAPRNIGRFNDATLLTLYAAALALRDAGWPDAAAGRPADIGLLTSSSGGCRRANIDYFRDYLANGRTLGRGNLFIYTLPTSAAAETAIALGLKGPMFHARPPDRPLHGLLCLADAMLTRGEASAVLAVQSDACQATCFVLATSDVVTHHGVCLLAPALVKAGQLPAGASPADALTILVDGKA
jgi:hypothetical protein